VCAELILCKFPQVDSKIEGHWWSSRSIGERRREERKEKEIENITTEKRKANKIPLVWYFPKQYINQTRLEDDAQQEPTHGP
jgi:hypothetical protein